MFSLTPMEGAIWQLGLSVQSMLATKVLVSIVFTGLVVLFLAKRVLWILNTANRGEDLNSIGMAIISYVGLVVVGLTFCRTSSSSMSPEDSNGQAWADYPAVRQNARYASLDSPTGSNLWWYGALHGSALQVSKFLTSLVGRSFSDQSYLQSPDLIFRLLTSTAAHEIDDPEVVLALDQMVRECTDTKEGRILDGNTAFKALFDLGKEGCQELYDNLQSSLKSWAAHHVPGLTSDLQEASRMSIPMGRFADTQAIESKVIGSALASYAKERLRRHQDSLNTHKDLLGIQDKEDHFWFSLQRVLAGGSWPALLANVFFDDGEAEASINRNEARLIYNNLLPSFKGYVKAFIALSFVAVAGGLCLGMIKPMMWWSSMVLMEMLYEPLSAFNYQIFSALVAASEIGQKFGDLSQDPLAVMGAALIDSQLTYYQTAFFLVQFVIAALFVVGVVGSGFAVQKMSFGHGAALGGAMRLALNSRLVGSVARNFERPRS